MNKKETRQRRAGKTRGRIERQGAMRLCINRSSNHTYAQVIAPEGAVVASASTVEKDLRGKFKHSGNKEAAAHVGKLIAERAVKAGIKAVAFDRSGFQYHGRVQALAEAAREAGLDF